MSQLSVHEKTTQPSVNYLQLNYI